MYKAILFFIFLSASLTSLAQSASYSLVIKNISVIDVLNSKIIPKQTIYIQEGRIAKISRSRAVKKTDADTIIDGTGKYLLPGFWDMHIHICWKDSLRSLFPVLLNFGITGVRDMGGSVQVLNTFKNQITNDPHSGPVIFGAGPILDGEKPIHPDFSVPLNENNVRQVLDSLYSKKVDFFKVYSLLPKPVLDSISRYAKEKHIPFAGHVSEFISPEEASGLGQNSFEHLNRLEDLAGDSVRFSAFTEMARRNNTWICPTLIVYQRKYQFSIREFLYHPLYSDLDGDLKNEWEQTRLKRNNTTPTEAEVLQSRNKFEKQKWLVKSMYDNGIPLLLGTDFAGMPFIYPGYSLHEEMALLRGTGIPPFEILKMATYNPAVFLGLTHLYGTVAQDKMADLIILNENPIIDIYNTQNIHLVIKSGKVVKR